MKTYRPVFRPSELVLAVAMLVPRLAGAQAASPATAPGSSATAAAAVKSAASPAKQHHADTAKTSAGQVASQPSFRLPATLTGNAALASPSPQTLSAAAGPNHAIPNAAQVTVRPAVADASQPAAAQPVVAAVKNYTGEAISVNLKDVDLKDFFRLVHEISGLNVVLDPAVRGSVTLVLDEVPWDQALDIVLRNNGLNKELDGNVLRIATRDTLKREANDERDLLKAETEAVDPVTVTRILSYAKASELMNPLKRFLSSRGDVMAIDRSNTLIIRDIPAVMPQVDNLIRQLDRKSEQVEIQARVVQASRSFARDIGTQFAASALSASPKTVYGGNNSVGTSPISHPFPPPLVAAGGSGKTMPLLTNLAAVAATSGLTFAHSSPNFALDYMITAAESKGVGKLLSSPQLITQNNALAEIKQGTQIPIQTTINNTISVQYVDAVLRLQVTPQITADGNVFMEVVVENTQVDSGIPLVNGIPALATQSAKTKVLVGDGGTVVIGGVMVSQQQTNIFQVPLFGNIPLIGHLFKETSVKVSSQELLFFLTPRLIPG